MASPICANPLLPAGYPHLCINQQCIIQRLQHTLRDAATNRPYYDYLSEKFEWPGLPEHLIHWPTIRLALKHFKATERRTVTKFIHEWLPLQDRHHVISTSALNLCPSCRQTPETTEHFLACPHPDRQQIWTALHESLYKHQITHSISNVFHDIIAFGLYQGRQAPTQLSFNHLPDDIHHLYQAQERLGWKQLYYGRFSSVWIQLLEYYHPQVNGLHYLAKCVTLIWQSVLQVWAVRNAHLHPGNRDQEDHSQLQATVNQILFEAHQDPLLQALVASIDAEQLMAQPTRRIRQWVTNSYNHMRAHSKAIKLQARLRTRDIRTYFPPRISHNSTAKNLLRPP